MRIMPLWCAEPPHPSPIPFYVWVFFFFTLQIYRRNTTPRKQKSHQEIEKDGSNSSLHGTSSLPCQHHIISILHHPHLSLCRVSTRS